MLEENFNVRSILIKLFIGMIAIGAISGFVGGAILGYSINTFQKNDSALNNLELLGTEGDAVTIAAVNKVRPSVVSIVISKDIRDISNSTGPNPFFDFDTFFPPPSNENVDPEDALEQFRRREIGGGSGFIITSDGLIVTNKHVVEEKDAILSVILNDGRQLDATVLDTDPFNDLAVIKIDAKDLPVLELGNSDEIEIGQSVIAIGNALGEFRNTVTKGIVSGIERRVVAGNGFGASEVIEEAIQTDAAINPGNSGGPLINLKGEVIGVNTAISQAGRLLGFAIPINTAKRVAESVTEYGRIVRPWLGVRYTLNNKTVAIDNDLSVEYGAILLPGRDVSESAVVPESPADKAGLKESDIILQVDGTDITENESLGNVISKYSPGDEAILNILRGAEEQLITVTLEEFKDE